MRYKIALLMLAICVHGKTALAAAETPISSADFYNSIGINTHFAFSLDSNSIWYQSTMLTDALIKLKITHVRDSLIPAYVLDSQYADSNYLKAFKTMGVAGIKVNLITSPTETYGNLGTIQSSVNSVIAINALHTGTVEAIEGPNELDNQSSWTYNGTTYSGRTGFAKGIVQYQADLYCAIKTNSSTHDLTVIGPSEGGTYSSQYGSTSSGAQPIPNGALYDYCDWGNFHPYTFGGNFATQHYSYDTIKDWYFGNSQSPSVNLSPSTTAGMADGTKAFAFQNYQQPYQRFTDGVVVDSRPMAATEKGYFTGTAQKSVSQSTFAKYIPRVFATDMRYGIARTYLYELVDEGANTQDPEQNFGLIQYDGTAKPAYYTLQHLLALTADTSTAKSKSTLDFTLNVTIPQAYQTADPNYFGIPETVEHLLLQKDDGTYQLLLWNEVSSSSLTDLNGNTLTGTARDIDVPVFTTKLSIATPIMSNATLYILNPYGTTAEDTLITRNVSFLNNELVLDVPDYVIILEFSAVPEPTTMTILGLAGIPLICRRSRNWGV